MGDIKPGALPAAGQSETTPRTKDELLRSVWSSTFPQAEFIDRFDDGTWFFSGRLYLPYTAPTLRQPDPDNAVEATYTPASAYYPKNTYLDPIAQVVAFDASGTVCQLIAGGTTSTSRASDGSTTNRNQPADFEYYKSTDRGQNFAPVASSLVSTMATLWAAFKVTHPNQPTTEGFSADVTPLGIWPDGTASILFSMHYGGYTYAQENHIIRTTNAGATWTATAVAGWGRITAPHHVRHAVGDCAVATITETTYSPAYLATWAAITSIDKGATWQKIAGGSSNRILTPGVIAYGAAPEIKVTEDNGATWATTTIPATDRNLTSILRLSEKKWLMVFNNNGKSNFLVRTLAYTPPANEDDETPLADRLTWSGVLQTGTAQFVNENPLDQVPDWVNGIGADKVATA